jgi:hypothetical protein
LFSGLIDIIFNITNNIDITDNNNNNNIDIIDNNNIDIKVNFLVCVDFVNLLPLNRCKVNQTHY